MFPDACIFSIVVCPNRAGIGPVNWLFDMMSWTSGNKVVILPLIGPVRKLFAKLIYRRSVAFQNDSGIFPVSKFPSTTNAIKPFMLPTSLGMVPLNEEVDASNSNKY